MATKTTKGIKITVENRYLTDESHPHSGQYIFGYQISIENQSPHAVQLLRRHWFIYDTIGIRKEVEGEGVIGVQPLINPGEKYQYTSWSPLKSGLGTMYGYYTMLRVTDNSQFVVEVPKFEMIAPVYLN